MVVVETSANSTARRVGLRPGDIIVSINGKDMRDVKQLGDLHSQRRSAWDFTVRRGGEEFRTVVRG